MNMRDIMRIVEGVERSSGDRIDALIQSAGFDENDLDIGTWGACGT